MQRIYGVRHSPLSFYYTLLICIALCIALCIATDVPKRYDAIINYISSRSTRIVYIIPSKLLDNCIQAYEKFQVST